MTEPAEGAAQPPPARAPRRRRRAALLLSCLLFSGTIQAVISAPRNWWPLSAVYLLPAFWAFGELRGRWAFLGGWLMGAAANITIFYWIVHTIEQFSNLPRAAAIGLLVLYGLAFGAYTGVFAAGLPLVRQVTGDWWPLGAAAWWTAVEFLNPQLFPYYQGVSLYQVPQVFLITTLTGVPGVTFQIIALNALWLWAFERRRAGQPVLARPWLRVAGVVAAGAALSLVVSATRLARLDALEAAVPTRRIALLQDNLDVDTRHELLRERGPDTVLDLLLSRSRQVLETHPGVDALVWAEGTLAGSPQQPKNAAVLELARQSGAELSIGGDAHGQRQDGTFGRFNSAFRIDRDGNIDARYDKNILLPFGEFMPLGDVFPILRRIEGVGNYIPGEGLRVYDAPFARFTFLICYEAIRSEYVRQGVRQGLDLLVNITYDAWFGDTSCAAEHLMLAAIQSAQYGLPLVRAATTGITAVVDARGVILHQTQVYEPDVVVADVPRASRPTVYADVGDAFAWACVLAAAAILGLGLNRRWEERRRAAAAPRSPPAAPEPREPDT